MWYVYSKDLQTDKEHFICPFDTAEEAVHHIAKCYRIDSELGQIGEYYYFMKKR